MFGLPHCWPRWGTLTREQTKQPYNRSQTKGLRSCLLNFICLLSMSRAREEKRGHDNALSPSLPSFFANLPPACGTLPCLFQILSRERFGRPFPSLTKTTYQPPTPTNQPIRGGLAGVSTVDHKWIPPAHREASLSENNQNN